MADRLRRVPLKGLGMGLADAVPGISGGTIALILGIHPRLVRAIAGLHPRLLRDLFGPERRQAWRDADLGFLVLLALGLGAGLLLGAKVLSIALVQVPTALMGLLLGMLVASIRRPAQVPAWNGLDITVATCSALIALLVTVIPGFAAPTAWWFLPIAGAIAACAMILPGISGSYLLLIMGLYATVIHAVSDLEVAVIILVGIGAVLGLLAFSRGLRHLLDHHNGATHAAMVGLLVGSLVRLWPWRSVAGFAEGQPIVPNDWMPVLWLAVGLAVGGLLEFMGRRPTTQNE